MNCTYCNCRRGRHLNTAAVVVTPCIGCTAQLYITELRLTTAPAHRTATRHRGLGHSARRPIGRPDLGPGHVPRAAGNRRRLHQSQAGAVTRSRRAGTAADRPQRPADRQQPNTRGGAVTPYIIITVVGYWRTRICRGKDSFCPPNKLASLSHKKNRWRLQVAKIGVQIPINDPPF